MSTPAEHIIARLVGDAVLYFYLGGCGLTGYSVRYTGKAVNDEIRCCASGTPNAVAIEWRINGKVATIEQVRQFAERTWNT